MENNMQLEIINNLALKIANLEVQNAALAVELKTMQEQLPTQNFEAEVATEVDAS